MLVTTMNMQGKALMSTTPTEQIGFFFLNSLKRFYEPEWDGTISALKK